MNTLYITRSGRILLDENNTPHPVDHSRSAIDNLFYVKEDTKVVYEKGEEKVECDAKAGDLVITFYEEQFPNKIIIVDNAQWKENINSYEEYEQKRKEEWAKRNAENCDKCCDCECTCCPG